jgi:hypothetical protein
VEVLIRGAVVEALEGRVPDGTTTRMSRMPSGSPPPTSAGRCEPAEGGDRVGVAARDDGRVALGDLVHVIRDADPADKADLYAQLGLTLTYRPQKRLVEAMVTPGHHMCKGFVSEGALEHGNRGDLPGSGRFMELR